MQYLVPGIEVFASSAKVCVVVVSECEDSVVKPREHRLEEGPRGTQEVEERA